MDGGAWWAAVHGVAKSQTRLSDFTFTFHFHALEKEMATHSSVLAWRIPGTGEPGGLPSMGSRRVGHDWSNVAAVAAAVFICGSSNVFHLWQWCRASLNTTNTYKSFKGNWEVRLIGPKGVTQSLKAEAAACLLNQLIGHRFFPEGGGVTGSWCWACCIPCGWKFFSSSPLLLPSKERNLRPSRAQPKGRLLSECSQGLAGQIPEGADGIYGVPALCQASAKCLRSFSSFSAHSSHIK